MRNGNKGRRDGMNRSTIISAPLIKEIREDGTFISTDAYFFNPCKVIWMKTRCINGDLKKPYTIIKLEETEPFMCEGDIEQYIQAMGMDVKEIYGWDYFEDEEDYDGE